MAALLGGADGHGMGLHGKRLVVCLIGVSLLCAAVAGSLVTPAAFSAPARARVTAVVPLNDQVLREINCIRREHGLVPLERSSQLTAAAANHSRSMASKGFFTHSSADGSAFWKRIARFYPTGRFGYWSVGENLVWQARSLDARQTIQRWMSSKAHRANLLNPDWRQIGLAAVRSPSAPGHYKDMAVTIITADFGVRS